MGEELQRIPTDKESPSWEGSQLARLVAVMHRLRHDCPWDAKQTHQSLVSYLIEETGEAVDAIETGSGTDMCEELGDLLLQVFFHAEIASETGRFDIERVAGAVCDKLIGRHPWVFGGEDVPADLLTDWEVQKRRRKGRKSALDGIAEHLSSLARAQKVIYRARTNQLPVELPDTQITPEQLGAQILALVGQAQASGVDADQAVRVAVRELEETIRSQEPEANRQ